MISRALTCALVLFGAGCSNLTMGTNPGTGGGSTGVGGGTGTGGSAGTGGAGVTGGGTGTGLEVCNNTVDDDGDGDVDCSDSDCFTSTLCFASCADLCTDGATICDGAGTRACRVDPATTCRVFGPITTCGNGLLCSGGSCVATCTDQCTAGAKQCSNTGGVVECRKLPSNCTDWVGPTACAVTEVCSGGACVPRTQCTNQCTMGATRCTAAGNVETCAKLASGCTDWSLATACAAGNTCPAGGTACMPVPKCTAGAQRCAAQSSAIETCDANGTWTATSLCPQACLNGACTAAATCTSGTVRCNGANVERCNSSGTAWLYNQTCSLACQGGLCTDACTAGAKRCNGNAPETCTGGAWVAAPACGNACFAGNCLEADLIVDGVERVLEGDQRFTNSVIVRNGGSIKVGPTGQLRLKAKSVLIDAASNINANGVGDSTTVPLQAVTVSTYSYAQYPASYAYCRNASGQYVSGYINVTCLGTQLPSNCDAGRLNPCAGQSSNPNYTLDDLSQTEGYRSGSAFGGGLVRLEAESLDIRGQITANALSSPAGGGSILLAADRVDMTGAMQVTAPSTTYNGFIKVVHGAVKNVTGSTTGRLITSVMPPLDLVSGSHPDPTRWYNDGLGDLFLAWSKPFPTINGYYWKLSTESTTLPSQAANQGTFLQAESYVVKAKDLVEGENFFHMVSVDSSANVGTVKATLRANINTAPPEVASVSHPNQGTWYQNPAVYLTWTNPQADSNFTGFYYVFDKYADTVPPVSPANFITNRQVLLSNTPDGIWVFHIVNRDTRGAITKAAEHFKVYVGVAPETENISGSVFDASNASAPLSGVSISINRGLFSQNSTATGTYTFNGNLFVGQWEVTASKAGYIAQTKQVTLVKGTPLNLNFSLTRTP